MPIVRRVYLSTSRSIIDYAAPVLSFVSKGRIRKLEAKRVILERPRNTRADIMRRAQRVTEYRTTSQGN